MPLPPMKPDERQFLDQLKAVQGHPTPRVWPRDIINSPGFPMNHKRAWRILEKWTRRDWYEYGVCLDLGWLTDDGKAA